MVYMVIVFLSGQPGWGSTKVLVSNCQDSSFIAVTFIFRNIRIVVHFEICFLLSVFQILSIFNCRVYKMDCSLLTSSLSIAIVRKFDIIVRHICFPCIFHEAKFTSDTLISDICKSMWTSLIWGESVIIYMYMSLPFWMIDIKYICILTRGDWIPF